MDQEVKFRQIDLQSMLFDLFTDVPIKIKKVSEKNRRLKKALENLDYGVRRIIRNGQELTYDVRESIGAARFLLHPKVQNEIHRVLLEGGPGRGKVHDLSVFMPSS